MEIRLYNTLTRQRDLLVPADPARVTMYVCGPTVYDRAHIGNARPAVVFDVLRRLLGHVYGDGHVLYARNITDIDDKIIARAEAEGVGIEAVTTRFEAHYLADMGALGVRPPDLAPHATTSIAAMVAMIERLIGLGHAYAADGHVLFEVATAPDYGRLSRRPMDEMIAGARVEVAPYKRAAADFVLWKPSAAEQPGWDSPWGRGRPGWHIECSAMIAEALGETIDIHGGGLDLQFPHHENELAQSSCAHGGAALAQIWMHNGFLTMAGDTKMSKSLGNVVTVDALLRDGWAGDVLRLALISAQYRQPLDWGERLLGEARARWQRWSEAADDDGGLESGVAPDARVLAALADDLNTPAALEAMSGLASAVFASKGAERLRLRAVLAASARLLGFGRLSLKTLEGDSGWLEALLEDYRAARAARDFARADGLRDEALARGVQLVVTKEGVSWRRA